MGVVETPARRCARGLPVAFASSRRGQGVDAAHEVGHKKRRTGRGTPPSACRPVRCAPAFHHHDAVGHRTSASSWSCVTMMVVTPSLRCRLRISLAQASGAPARPAPKEVHPAAVGRARWPGRAPAQCAAAARRRAALGYLISLPGRPTSFDQLRSRGRLIFGACGMPAVHQAVGHVVGHR